MLSLVAPFSVSVEIRRTGFTSSPRAVSLSVRIALSFSASVAEPCSSQPLGLIVVDANLQQVCVRLDCWLPARRHNPSSLWRS